MSPPTEHDEDIIREVNLLAESLERDEQFAKRVAEFKDTTLVLSATDTGRELIIELDGRGVRARLYAGEPFDVKILATEEIHSAVLHGRMDADAAFFSGKVKISGSIVAAFRVKNSLLGLLQQHLGRRQETLEGEVAKNEGRSRMGLKNHSDSRSG